MKAGVGTRQKGGKGLDTQAKLGKEDEEAQDKASKSLRRRERRTLGVVRETCQKSTGDVEKVAFNVEGREE